MKKNSGERTLLASVLLSSPGPLVLGVALFFGRSSTQLDCDWSSDVCSSDLCVMGSVSNTPSGWRS